MTLSWFRRFLAGMLSKDQSIGTGIVFGLLVWTLTRLVDEVTGSATIEYRMDVRPAVLADGRAGSNALVTLTNLSRAQSVANLKATLADPAGVIVFSSDPKDSGCALQPPIWGEDPDCSAYATGFNFSVPMVVPGKWVKFSIKYTEPAGNAAAPVLRIKPDGAGNFRLIEPGVETFIVRHETGLLLGVLGVALLLFFWSTATGVVENRNTKSTGD